MQHLSQRLEQLEKHVSSSTGDGSPPPVSLPTPAGESVPRRTPVPRPGTPLTVADGQESWVTSFELNHIERLQWLTVVDLPTGY